MKRSADEDFCRIAHFVRGLSQHAGGHGVRVELKQMDNIRNPAKGLSVWMWGPVLWSILHTIAFLCDTVHAPTFDAVIIETFFKYVQPLLPCEYCRDSYGGFLQEVVRARGETVQQAFRDRHMVSFVVDLHDKVNTKLAKQRWNQVVGVLRSKLSDGACKELFSCEGLEEEIAPILDKRPTLTVVRNRLDLYKRDVINVEGVLLLVLVFAYRVQPKNAWNFTLVLATIATMLKQLPREDAIEAGTQMRDVSEMLKTQAKSDTIDTGLLVDELHKVLFSYSKPTVSQAVFRDETEKRLVLMLAKACGQGTCK